jgi:hypothetical protein
VSKRRHVEEGHLSSDGRSTRLDLSRTKLRPTRQLWRCGLSWHRRLSGTIFFHRLLRRFVAASGRKSWRACRRPEGDANVDSRLGLVVRWRGRRLGGDQDLLRGMRERLRRWTTAAILDGLTTRAWSCRRLGKLRWFASFREGKSDRPFSFASGSARTAPDRRSCQRRGLLRPRSTYATLAEL